MCATVCPSQALFFGTREQVEHLRPLSAPTNRFRFGGQLISTRVYMMVPARTVAAPWVDVTAALDERPPSRSIPLRPVTPAPAVTSDPFAGVEV